MSLSHLIELAGGIDNIQRILVDDENYLTVSLVDEIKPTSAPSNVSLDNVNQEWQLTTPLQGDLDSHLIDDISNALSQRFSEQIKYIEVKKCPFRPTWHISPPQGLLNDPNGFVFHQGQYHLFYQWNPFACEHRDKCWAHLTSEDLINWKWLNPALAPTDWYDSHGVFSGHAVSKGEELYLFYTGNSRIGHNRKRQTTQCLATSSDGAHFKKHGPVIKQLPEGVTAHIRDPKIYFRNGVWNMLLGAQTDDLKGRLALYQSEDMLNWEYQGLLGDELGDFGYMWECPDFFELSGQHFVVLGPQGVKSNSQFDTNPHRNRIFSISEQNDSKFSFEQEWTLDYGFDFYAPQTTLTEDGRRVMVGWMGLPDDINQPTIENGWIHQLTMQRELIYQDGKLTQKPIVELEQLMSEAQAVTLGSDPIDIETKSFELTVTLDSHCTLSLMENQQYRITLAFDPDRQAIRVDRSQTISCSGDTVREVTQVGRKVKLAVYADNSSLEIFINDGEKVMSGRAFTPEDATCISLTGEKAEAVLRNIYPSIPPFSGE